MRLTDIDIIKKSVPLVLNETMSITKLRNMTLLSQRDFDFNFEMYRELYLKERREVEAQLNANYNLTVGDSKKMTQAQKELYNLADNGETN